MFLKDFVQADYGKDRPIVAQEYITVKTDMDILSHELVAYFFSKPA